MATYNPPTQDLVIFDNSVFTDSNPSGNLTRAQADLLYLHFPFGQGAETIPSVTITGTSTLSGTVSANNNLILGGEPLVNYLEFPDGTKQYVAAIDYLNTDNNWYGKNQFYGDVSLNAAVTINGASFGLSSVPSTSDADNILVYDTTNNLIKYEPSGNLITASNNKLLSSNNSWSGDNSFNNIQIASTKNINYAGLIDIREGNTSKIYTDPATNNLVLAPTGQNVSLLGKTLAMGGGEVHNCSLVHSIANSNITIDGSGVNGGVIIKSANVSISGDNLSITGLPSASKANQIYYDTTTNKLSYSPIPSSASNTFYVATNGNDTTGVGSINAPYLTIQKAIDQCTSITAYYSIYIAAGSYTEALTIAGTTLTGSPRISLIGATNTSNSKGVSITGSLSITLTTATGNEANNIIACNNLVITNSAANAVNVSGQGFSLFFTNCNLITASTSSTLTLSSSATTTRYYFDRTNVSNSAVTSTNPLVYVSRGAIWAVTGCDFTNANTGGTVITVTTNNALLLNVSSSVLTNNQAGVLVDCSSTLSAGNCGFSNSTYTAYASATSAMFLLGNAGGLGVGGGYSFLNNTIVNANVTYATNSYISLRGGVTLQCDNNIFYNTKTTATAFVPFNSLSGTNNVFRYNNNVYINSNTAGTNTVTYPTVNGTSVIISDNILSDVNYTRRMLADISLNGAVTLATDIWATSLASTADTNAVSYNTTTKKLGYVALPAAPSTLLASNNTWAGKNQFNADVSLNGTTTQVNSLMLMNNGYTMATGSAVFNNSGNIFFNSLADDYGDNLLTHTNSNGKVTKNTYSNIFTNKLLNQINTWTAEQIFGSQILTFGLGSFLKWTQASVSPVKPSRIQFFTSTASLSKTIITLSTDAPRVGIYNDNPLYELDVSGTVNISGNTYVIGRLDVSGNVGIGTTSPAEKLNVNDPSTAASVTVCKLTSAANPTGISETILDVEKGSGYGARINGIINQGTGSSAAFVCMNGGSASTYIVCSSYVTSGGNFYVSSLGTGTVYSNAGWVSNTNPSDPTIKKNITSLNDNSNNICKIVSQLNPISFEWIDEKMGMGTKYGFSAKQISELIPDIASTFNDASGNIKYSYDPVSLIPFLTTALQTKSSKIDELENKISQLEQQHAELKNKYDLLEDNVALLLSKM